MIINNCYVKEQFKEDLKKKQNSKDFSLWCTSIYILLIKDIAKKRFRSKKLMSQRSILTSHFHVFYILRKEEAVNFLELFFIPLHFISIFIDIV